MRVGTLGEKHSLEIDAFDSYLEKYGSRFTRALESVEAGKVKKYVLKDAEIVRWIVVGNEKDYIIIDDNYCSCYDFFHRVLLLQEIDKCYHLLAKMVAEKAQKFDTFEITFQEFLKFLREWI